MRPDRTRLFEVASEQSGYFAGPQARECGYGWVLLSHHVKSGQFLRIRPRHKQTVEDQLWASVARSLGWGHPGCQEYFHRRATALPNPSSSDSPLDDLPYNE